MDLPDTLLQELLEAPDRDGLALERPIVSVRADDEPAFLRDVDRLASARLDLERRGIWHGTWVELRTRPDAHEEFFTTRQRSGMSAGDAEQERWASGRPVLLREVAREIPEQNADDIEHALTRFERLARREGLAEWLATRRDALAPDFGVGGALELVDQERDLARVSIAAPGMDDLWIKSSRLSTHPDDASLRMRFSFGREGHDDANPDPARARAVHELAARALPEVRAVLDVRALRRLLDSWCATHVLPTQAIAYWNAPNGGALFHHDAFDEPFEQRQLGVLFVQLSGRTAWLALSIEDLALRVREFLGHMSDGELPWVRADLFPEVRRPARADEGRPLTFPEALSLASDWERLQAELFEPGCGRLGALVERGPEFTAFLADAGHACLLRPGDALLLPNFGRERTVMHSVFCASHDITYALSFGLRAASPMRATDRIPSSST